MVHMFDGAKGGESRGRSLPGKQGFEGALGRLRVGGMTGGGSQWLLGDDTISGDGYY